MISPTLACANYLHLQADIEAMDQAGVDFYHIDIMDGHYVPNLCLNFEFIQAVRQISNTPMGAHLMVLNPMDYIKRLQESGITYVAAHIDVLKDNAGYFVDKVHRFGMKAGLVLSPEDPVEELLPYLKDLQYVLVMSVCPGFAGQAFQPEMMKKVEELKKIREEEGLDFLIEVDGGVGWDNVAMIKEAGADVVVAGVFAVFHQKESLYDACRAFRKESM